MGFAIGSTTGIDMLRLGALGGDLGGDAVSFSPFRQHFLLANPLSILWSCETIKQPMLWPGLVIAYACGAVGYALSLPARVLIFVFGIFSLISSLFGDFTTVSIKLKCVAAATGELLSGVIGLACPPLAYSIDEVIEEESEANAEIQTYMPWMGQWHEIEAIADDPPIDHPPIDHPPIDHPPIDHPPIDHSLVLSEHLTHWLQAIDHPPIDHSLVLSEHLTHWLQGAKDTMKAYLSDDFLDGLPGELFQAHFFIALLLAFSTQHTNNPKDFLKPIKAIRYLNPCEEGGYSAQWTNINGVWAALQRNYGFQKVVNSLILTAIDRIAVEDEDGCYLPGKRGEVTNSLQSIHSDPDFDKLFSSFTYVANGIYLDNRRYTTPCAECWSVDP